MVALNFYVRGWRNWPSSAPQTQAVPPLLRRRVTPVGQQALAAAWGLPDATRARLILSSRHGEFSRTLSLLDEVVRKEEASPADFTLSVHNALIGLLSIAQQNRKGHSAVAAGQESFCFGLLEAAACLQQNPQEPVMLMHFDDRLPESFAAFDEPDNQPLALALSLSATGPGEALQMEMQPATQTTPSASHARDFIGFLRSDAREVFSAGEGRQWRWARHAMA